MNQEALLYEFLHTLDSPLKTLHKKTEKELENIGVFCRVFSRIKSAHSTLDKISTKNYNNTKKLQDLIGLRIGLYFQDDITIAEKSIKKIFTIHSSSIDNPDSQTFKPTRINYTAFLKDSFPSKLTTQLPIDNTFEIQIRTILSEGWHEVEHDLRYKNRKDWDKSPDLDRMFNATLAALETSEWTMLKILEELAYQHYQKKNWEPMMRSKFRIRFKEKPISPQLNDTFNKETTIAKALYKQNRLALLDKLLLFKGNIPLTYDNIIFIWNYFFHSSKLIQRHYPTILIKTLEQIEKI